MNIDNSWFILFCYWSCRYHTDLTLCIFYNSSIINFNAFKFLWFFASSMYTRLASFNDFYPSFIKSALSLSFISVTESNSCYSVILFSIYGSYSLTSWRTWPDSPIFVNFFRIKYCICMLSKFLYTSSTSELLLLSSSSSSSSELSKYEFTISFVV